MGMTDLVIEPLARSHDRAGFCCGVEPLDRYLREQASQDVKRRATACFVARESSGSRILGYYTLSAGGVALTDLPESLARKLPRYPSVPVARLGRLAVDREFRGKKLGAVLLARVAVGDGGLRDGSGREGRIGRGVLPALRVRAAGAGTDAPPARPAAVDLRRGVTGTPRVVSRHWTG